jgi:formate dehydrogenase major subunit
MLLQRKSSTPSASQQAGALDHGLGESALRGVQSSVSAGMARMAKTMDRRSFLKRSGVGAGAGAIVAGGVALPAMDKAIAQEAKKVEIKRTVCTHCSVGCAIDAVVENGVWVRQEPVFDSPINLGAHCAKGAAIREHGHGEYRLKKPMKLVAGKYVAISWEQALSEISARLIELKKAS